MKNEHDLFTPASPSQCRFHMDEHGERFAKEEADILLLQHNLEQGDREDSDMYTSVLFQQIFQ